MIKKCLKTKSQSSRCRIIIVKCIYGQWDQTHARYWFIRIHRHERFVCLCSPPLHVNNRPTVSWKHVFKEKQSRNRCRPIVHLLQICLILLPFCYQCGNVPITLFIGSHRPIDTGLHCRSPYLYFILQVFLIPDALSASSFISWAERLKALQAKSRPVYPA